MTHWAQLWKSRMRDIAATLAVLALTAFVYGPVRGLGLVWDDKPLLHDKAWLREGNEWISIALHGLADWTNYFRPLGVALFTAEARLFDAAPAPMHLLSLGLHLLNTLLVGTLARSMLKRIGDRSNATLLPYVAMLLFGLHPALIEPIAWISSQCELLVTLFTLLGLVANATLRHKFARAIVVALCFFLAACAKEAAVSFPLLLLTFDWISTGEEFQRSGAAGPKRARYIFRALLRRQGLVYLSVFLAGIAYLAFRYWGLGFLTSSYGQAMPLSWVRLQLICFTYLTYWKLLVWPMSGLGPIHIVPEQQFAEFTFAAAAIDAAALAIASTGAYLLWKRRPLGGLIVAVTVTLLPVLHIVPTDFDESIFHDRYAMTALAVACSFLPLVAVTITRQRESPRRLILYCAMATGVWLLVATINIRATLPLWSDEVRLWEWALRQNPGSVVVEDHLLQAYLDSNDLTRAQSVADVLMRDGRSCPNCMINVAYLAVGRGDAERASIALQEAKKAMDKLVPVRQLIVGYILTLGSLSQLQQDPDEAARAYQAAISVDPLNPDAYMSLAFLQARQGNFGEARKTAETALSLCPADDRARRRHEFEQVLAAVGFGR